MYKDVNNYSITYQNQGAANSKVGTATAAHVLTGKTFTNSSGVGLTGTMANKGAWTNTPTAKGKVTIPAGYHNGSGYVDTTSVYNKGVTDADARANANSINYQTGYNAGVAAADGRANANSANYQAGYNAGYNTGKSEMVIMGSANLIAGRSDGGMIEPTFSLNVADYNSVTINVTGVTNNHNSLTIYADNGISQRVGPGTYTYDITSASILTFTSSYDITAPSNCAFNYTLN